MKNTDIFNGDSDRHFSLNSTSLTSEATENSKMSIRHKFGHDHNNGWGVEEIYKFADGMIKGSDPFVTITNTKVENGIMAVSYIAPSDIMVEKATMYYITERNLPYNGEITWEVVNEYFIENDMVTMKVPSEATFCYATLTDSCGCLISTKYIDVN